VRCGGAWRGSLFGGGRGGGGGVGALPFMCERLRFMHALDVTGIAAPRGATPVRKSFDDVRFAAFILFYAKVSTTEYRLNVACTMTFMPHGNTIIYIAERGCASF
jgi:hypothetical protein